MIHLTKAAICTSEKKENGKSYVKDNRGEKKVKHESIPNKIVCQVKYVHYSNANNLLEYLLDF